MVRKNYLLLVVSSRKNALLVVNRMTEIPTFHWLIRGKNPLPSVPKWEDKIPQHCCQQENILIRSQLSTLYVAEGNSGGTKGEGRGSAADQHKVYTRL